MQALSATLTINWSEILQWRSYISPFQGYKIRRCVDYGQEKQQEKSVTTEYLL